MATQRIECEGSRDPACVERFWVKVAKPNENGCRIWGGAINTTKKRKAEPRGRFAGGPRIAPGKARRNVYAHVFAWSLENGDVPDGEEIRHTCDVSLCCEASHMTTGTASDNRRDLLERHVNDRGGEGGSGAKLTHQQAAEVYALARQGAMTQAEIAERYGITQPMVSLIKNDRRRAYSVTERAA